MKKNLFFLLLLSLFCCISCVSKKKYLACESERNYLDGQCIRQRKSLDTLNVELQKKQLQVDGLMRDTLRRAIQFRHMMEDLNKTQNLLTSSKKELNERLSELQQKQAGIQKLQRRYHAYKDSLDCWRNEFLQVMDSLSSTDSAYKEIRLDIRDRDIQLLAPESLFFSATNKNFISARGKNICSVIANMMLQHPGMMTRIDVPAAQESAPAVLKENMDKSSVRAASICRYLVMELHVSEGCLTAGTSIQPNSGNISFLLYGNTDHIFEHIEKL